MTHCKQILRARGASGPIGPENTAAAPTALRDTDIPARLRRPAAAAWPACTSYWAQTCLQSLTQCAFRPLT